MNRLHLNSLCFAAVAQLPFLLKVCSYSLYVLISISNSSGVKYTDLFLLPVAMVKRVIGAPLMLDFHGH